MRIISWSSINIQNMKTHKNHLPESTTARGKANTPLPAISPAIKTAADKTLSPLGLFVGM